MMAFDGVAVGSRYVGGFADGDTSVVAGDFQNLHR